MKKILLSALLFCSLITNAQVGIGVSVANIEPSAQLEVKSTNKGLLTPRMNEAQKNAIDNPATGLLVYQTDGTSGFYYYDGNVWKQGATDTASLSSRINTKLSLSDTSAMLLNYKTGLNNKMNWIDTTNMLAPYTIAINQRVKYTDTSDMLFNYKTGLNNKMNWIDTTNMLSKYLRKSDTASLSDRINAKLSKTDTVSLSDRINAKLNSTVFPYYPGLQKGHIMYWNGSNWVNLNPGTAGQVLKMSSAADPVPVWGTDATASTTAFYPCGTTITDIDGNAYNTVLIGSQCWTKENLRVRRYNNGTVIGFNAEGGSGGSGGGASIWQNSTIGLHAIYASDSVSTPSNLTKYGYLYNWYAAKGIYTTGTILSNDTANICPSGWHVPTDAEWTTLTTELGGESVAGGKMKSIGTHYWSSQSAGTDNSSGFSALPGGFRLTDGSYNNLIYSAAFWRSTEIDANSAWSSRLEHNSNDVSRESYQKSRGACIRCIKD
jgi:uncharacterized protein (TIGR02145 family)